MTVAEFLRKNLMLGSEVLDMVSIWSNEACRGYCVDAMERAGLDRETIGKVLSGLHEAFDELTVEEAERKWVQW